MLITRSRQELVDWMCTHEASAMLCMKTDKQPDFTALPPRLASMAAEIWALITSPHIQHLAQLQKEFESINHLVPAEKEMRKLEAKCIKASSEMIRKGLGKPRMHIRLLIPDAEGDGVGSHLAAGRFDKVVAIYTKMVSHYTYEVEASNVEKLKWRSYVAIRQMDAEMERRLVAYFCSRQRSADSDKAKIGYRIHYANRLDEFSHTCKRVTEVYRNKAAVEREMLEHYKKIHKRLTVAVRIQAEQGGGSGSD